MLFSESFLETVSGDLLMTFLVAMAPVVELRGAIPAGIASGLPPALACIAAIAVVFYLGPAGHLRQIRRLRTVPDLAERPLVIAVSH